VLPPHCSIIIAHSAPQEAGARLGITYDHRVLDGEAAAQFLNFVAKPTME
jgi:pyruvate/2-oxoglutarate dehydrogenase complex dihydrolipoamide acyltransferase (E2) component